MDVLDKALIYAIAAHEGANRKGGINPYILHPLEAAVIAGTMTNDREVMAAAALHDVVEDTDHTIDDIREHFGDRIAALVGHETENKRPGTPPAESWKIRKLETLEALAKTKDINLKILWLSDKLSNVRAFYRDEKALGIGVFERFNQKDPAEHAWYYLKTIELLDELKGTAAYEEYAGLAHKTFDKYVKPDDQI